MSEGFDREAERERLRRQLEEDEEERKATQQMSELLLKGATMTNKHCDECGDPIFRYQGQEFCPTCEQTVSSGGTADQANEASAGDAADDTDGTAADAQLGSAPDGQEQPPQRSADQSRQPRRQAVESADLDEARASLVRTLTALANQAEATNDIGRVREILAAAREAAEAIAALEGARR